MKLREARELRGLSQEEVAAQLGLSRAAYAKYEMGTRTPSLELLLRMADNLGVSMDFLLDRERKYDACGEDPYFLTIHEKQIISGLRSTNAEMRQAIYVIVMAFLKEEKRFPEGNLYEISERLKRSEDGAEK